MLEINIFILITITSLLSSAVASSPSKFQAFAFVKKTSEQTFDNDNANELNSFSNSEALTRDYGDTRISSINSNQGQIKSSEHLADSTNFLTERKQYESSQIEQKRNGNSSRINSKQNNNNFYNVTPNLSDFQQNSKRRNSASYHYSPDRSAVQKRILYEEEEESLSGLIKALKILVIIVKVMTQIVSALLPGNSTCLLIGISFKMTTRIKYMDIAYSTDLDRSFIETWNEKYLSLGYGFGMPDFMGYNQNPKDIPLDFAKYGITQNFLINFWESLVILVLIMLLFIGAQLTESLLAANNKTNHFIARKIRISIQCLLLTQLYIIFGDIILFACLEWRYIDFSQTFTILSFGFSLVFTVIPIGCLVLQFLLVQKFQQDRTSNPNNDDEQRIFDFYKLKYPVSQIFFQDFKIQSLTCQSFLFLLILRDVLFSAAIAFLSISPLTQAIILVLFSLPLGVFIVIFRPFKNWWNTAQQIFYELIIFVVAIDVIIMETFDQSDLPAISPRKKIGLSIIIVQICFAAIGLIYLFVGLFAFLNNLVKNWQLAQNPQSVQNRRDRLRDLNIRISQGAFPIFIEDNSMIQQQEGLIIGSTTVNSQIMMRQEEVFNFDTLEVPSEKFNSSNQSMMSQTKNRFQKNKIFPISSRPNEDSVSFADDDSFIKATSTKNLVRRPLHQRAPKRNARRQMNKSMSQFWSSEPGFAYLKKYEGKKASHAHNNFMTTKNEEQNMGDFKAKRAQILENLNKKFVQKPKVNSLVEL